MRVPVHVPLGRLAPFYLAQGPLGPEAAAALLKGTDIAATFRLLNPETKTPIPGLEVHVRTETEIPKDPKVIGGITTNVTTDPFGKFTIKRGSLQGADTNLYVSLTPYMPGVPRGKNKAILWRWPITFSKSPQTIDILLEPGAGLDPNFPGAPRRITAFGLALLVLGGLALIGLGVYLLTREKQPEAPLPAMPQEAPA